MKVRAGDKLFCVKKYKFLKKDKEKSFTNGKTYEVKKATYVGISGTSGTSGTSGYSGQTFTSGSIGVTTTSTGVTTTSTSISTTTTSTTTFPITTTSTTTVGNGTALLYITDDTGMNRYIHNNEIPDESSLGKIFITQSELRRQKIKKLNESQNKI